MPAESARERGASTLKWACCCGDRDVGGTVVKLSSALVEATRLMYELAVGVVLGELVMSTMGDELELADASR